MVTTGTGETKAAFPGLAGGFLHGGKMTFKRFSRIGKFLTAEKMCLLLCTISLLSSVGCLHDPEPVKTLSDYGEEYIKFWEKCEMVYPMFDLKGIDWDEEGEKYYTLALNCESKTEFIEILMESMAVFEDPFMTIDSLDSFNNPIKTFYPYVGEWEENYDRDVLLEHYLEPNGWAGWEDGYINGLGWCDPEQLPYLFVDSFPNDSTLVALDSLDSFIAECIALNVPAVIVDLRMNPWGRKLYGYWTNPGSELMGRFAAKSYPGGVYLRRWGPAHDSFFQRRPVSYPRGPEQYTGTVILLTGDYTICDAEETVCHSINFPNVVLVGDTTGGNVSFGAALVTMCGDLICKVTRYTMMTFGGHWIEGAGIPPDFYVQATEADFAAGIDPVLDYAIDMLDSYPAGH